MCTAVGPVTALVENKYRSAAGKLSKPSRYITIQLTWFILVVNTVRKRRSRDSASGGLMSAEANRGRKRMRKKPEETGVQFQKRKLSVAERFNLN